MGNSHSVRLFNLIAGLLVGLASAAAAPVSETALRFESRGQPLFGGGSGALAPKRFEVHLIDEQVPATTVGEIRRLPTEVPVDTLVRIWNQALTTCRAQGYTVPVVKVRITPTSAECITGEIRRRYCTFPPQLEWTYCPAFGNVRKTYVRDLGAGIGPRPTQGTTRPYEVGAIVTYSADVRVGVEGELAIEPGTVDVDVVGTGRLQASTDSADEGAIVRIETSFTPDRLASKMRTRFPQVDMSIGSFIKTNVHASAEYAGIDHEDGSQLRATRVLYDADTLNSDLDFVGVGGEVRFWDREWLGFRAGPRGLQVRFLEIPVPILEPAFYRDDVFVPMTVPGPHGDLISPPPGTPLFSHADYAVLSPELDTPAAGDFECGGCAEVVRSFVDAQGRIVSTTPVGPRTVLAGFVSDRGFTLPFVNDGIQDSDVLRLDLDVDSVSYASAVPLGATFKGPNVKYLGALGPAIAIELNAIDFDIASFWSFDQLVRFDPRMRVRLEFSRSVSARVVGDPAFKKVSRLTVPVGTPVEFRQTAGGVKITPVFLLDQNRFENDTQLMVTPTVQGTLGQVRMSGLITSMVSGAFDLPTNAAVLQWTPGILKPINLGLFGKTDVVLGGFKGKRGRPVSVATRVAPDGQT